MKKLLILAMIAGAALVYSCSEEPEAVEGCTDSSAQNHNPEATKDDGSCTYASGGGSGSGSGSGTSGSSQVMFWHDAPGPSGSGFTTVTMNGSSAQITKYNSTSKPDCGNSNYANFTGLTPGKSYSYTASDKGGAKWSGSITAPDDGKCLRLKLNY
jgi:hypothetical protein